jgi:PRD1 phage membrane DNA delivery
MDELTHSVTTILLAIVGVGLVAILISRNANTTGVIQASASGFSNALATAQSPVTGNQVQINTSYPSDQSVLTMPTGL